MTLMTTRSHDQYNTTVYALDDRYRGVFGEYDIPRGCIGAYYPESNPLVPLSSVGDVCNTPTSKSIPVLPHRSSEPATVPAF